MSRQKAARRVDPGPSPANARSRGFARADESTGRKSIARQALAIVAACLVAGGIAAYWFSPSTVVRRDLARGRAYDKAGQGDLAAHEFNAAVDADGKNPNAWWALAEHDYNAGQWEEAHDAYAEVLKLRPSTPHIYSRMAVCAMKSNEPVTAYDLAEKALKIDPNDVDALGIDVPISVSNGFGLRDLDNIRRLGRLKPDDPQVLTLLGNALVSQGLYDEAKPVVDHLLTVSPNDAYGLFERDVITVQTSSTPAQLAEAVDDLKTVIAKHPHYYLGYRFLGKAYADQSRWVDAAAELQQAAKLQPNRKEIQFELMDAYRHAGDPAKLAAAQARFDRLQKESDESFRLEKQVDLDPDNYEANLRLGEIRIDQGEYRVAHRYIARAAQINPNDPRVIKAVNTLVNAGGKDPGEEN